MKYTGIKKIISEIHYHTKFRCMTLTLIILGTLLSFCVIYNWINCMFMIHGPTAVKEMTTLPSDRDPTTKYNERSTFRMNIRHENNEQSPGRKTVVRHIAFLKVHKCASSTAQNLFLRFGYHRHSVFLFGKTSRFQPYENVISVTETLNDKNVIPPPVGKSFDIMCCHVRYNRIAFQKFMPPDTAYIGIVRDPFDQFISSLRYFRPSKILISDKRDPIMEFLKHPTKYRTLFESNDMMAHEFGFPEALFEHYNDVAVQRYLKNLEREFLLVIIVEHFDESLILLKRLLGWGYKDIMYVRKNISRKEKLNLYITPEQRRRYYYLEKFDTSLYKFFYDRLWDQIRSQGADFYDELLLFQRMQKDVADFCDAGYHSNNLVIPHSSLNREFTVTKHDCFLMNIREIPFVKFLKKRQYGLIDPNSTLSSG